MMSWIFYAVVKPMLLYGVLAWANRVAQNSVLLVSGGALPEEHTHGRFAGHAKHSCTSYSSNLARMEAVLALQRLPQTSKGWDSIGAWCQKRPVPKTHLMGFRTSFKTALSQNSTAKIACFKIAPTKIRTSCKIAPTKIGPRCKTLPIFIK